MTYATVLGMRTQPIDVVEQENQIIRTAKPQARRLVVLDVLLLVACLIQFFNNLLPWLRMPVLLSQLVLLGYGLYMLTRLWEHARMSIRL